MNVSKFKCNKSISMVVDIYFLISQHFFLFDENAKQTSLK